MHGLQYTPAQVVVSNGAKHSLHNVFTAMCNPGDEVIIPAPYWVSYAELVKLTGGDAGDCRNRRRRQLQTDAGTIAGRDHAEDDHAVALLARRIRPAACTRPRSWAQLADVVLERNLTVVTDEIYERLVYGEHRFASFATVRPGLQERTVVVNGASKAYAMTGWRIGWTLSPAKVATAMADLQSQETSNPWSISQYAALAALEGPQQCVDTNAGRVRQAARVCPRADRRHSRLTCPDMAGAFYAFVNIKQHLGRKYGGSAGRQLDRNGAWRCWSSKTWPR